MRAAVCRRFSGYRGFPASICASPNDMVVHGIPGAYRVAEGDLLSIDVGVTLDGYVADSAITLPMGAVDAEARAPARRHGGVAGGRPWPSAARAAAWATSRTPCRRSSRRPGSASCARWSGTASAGRCTRTRRSPTTGTPGRGPRLEEGMVFAIEPMVNVGGHEVYVADDGWSISTDRRFAVGALRAHRRRGQEGAAGAHAPPLGSGRDGRAAQRRG